MNTSNSKFESELSRLDDRMMEIHTRSSRPAKEEALGLLQQADHMFGLLPTLWDGPAADAQTYVAAASYAINGFINLAIDTGASIAESKTAIPKTIALCSASSFIHHIQTWPLGYPGDFTAVNMIVDKDEKAHPGAIGYGLGMFALESPIVSQHREKLAHQTRLVKSVCFKNQSPKIMSMGCGPSRDIEAAINDIKQAGAEIVLVDFDGRALKESLHRLVDIKDRLITIKANILNFFDDLKAVSAEKKGFDLIFAGGVFDYFDQATVLSILESLAECVAEEGTLFFTNIDQGNPFKGWMEVICNWRLTERSTQDMTALVEATGFSQCSLALDSTKLTWLAEVKKK